MRLSIDNQDGLGARDYTRFLDARTSPRITRLLNRPAKLQFGLVDGDGFVVPGAGARVTVERGDGGSVFAGYIVATPVSQYVGRGEKGAVYRYEVEALSDEMVLDQKTPPPRPAFVARSAGDAVRQLSEEALAGWLDTSGAEAGDSIPYYAVNPAKSWSAVAAEIALAARCAYRCDGDRLLFAPIGETRYELSEESASFSPGDLTLRRVNRVTNDLTVLGPLEPGAYVTDYFVGDGLTTRFYLSQIPFTRLNVTSGASTRTILYEEYGSLDPTHWKVTDPAQVISVAGGKLQVAGGTGVDGQTRLDFIEKIELGGATVLQHGDVAFSAASDGVLGGLYAGTVSVSGCLAGFRITPSGANSAIQALIAGSTTGPVITTTPGHHYFFTTQLYPAEMYRMQQVFHSSLHESGDARGGNAVNCGVRVVLEVHEIDPANPATQVAPAVVLYDDVIANAPGFCTYALVNSAACTAPLRSPICSWLPTRWCAARCRDRARGRGARDRCEMARSAIFRASRRCSFIRSTFRRRTRALWSRIGGVGECERG